MIELKLNQSNPSPVPLDAKKSSGALASEVKGQLEQAQAKFETSIYGKLSEMTQKINIHDESMNTMSEAVIKTDNKIKDLTA